MRGIASDAFVLLVLLASAALTRAADAPAAHDKQIVIHVQAIRVSVTRLQELGFDFAAANDPLCALLGITNSGDATKGKVRGQIVNRAQLSRTIESYKSRDAIKVLAEPTLITADKRPASLHAGGEFPVRRINADKSLETTYQKFGTQLDVVPTLLGEKKVRLEIRPRISELDYKLGHTIDGVTTPGVRVAEMDTRLEMELGQTVVIGGLKQARERVQVDPESKRETATADETATYFVVTAELAESTPAVSAAKAAGDNQIKR